MGPHLDPNILQRLSMVFKVAACGQSVYPVQQAVVHHPGATRMLPTEPAIDIVTPFNN